MLSTVGLDISVRCTDRAATDVVLHKLQGDANIFLLDLNGTEGRFAVSMSFAVMQWFVLHSIKPCQCTNIIDHDTGNQIHGRTHALHLILQCQPVMVLQYAVN